MLSELIGLKACSLMRKAKQYRAFEFRLLSFVCFLQLLSLSIDFYVRVFVRVYTSAIEVKDAATKLMYVHQSSGCDSFYVQAVGRKVAL